MVTSQPKEGVPHWGQMRQIAGYMDSCTILSVVNVLCEVV